MIREETPSTTCMVTWVVCPSHMEVNGIAAIVMDASASCGVKMMHMGAIKEGMVGALMARGSYGASMPGRHT